MSGPRPRAMRRDAHLRPSRDRRPAGLCSGRFGRRSVVSPASARIGLGDRGVDGREDVGHPIVGWGHAKPLGRIRVAVFVFAIAHLILPFLIPVAALLFLGALTSPAPQPGQAGRRQRPIRLGPGDAPAGAARRRARELVGRRADVHAGVGENEVVEVDELAFQPQSGAGVGEVGAGDPAVADRALGEALVEPAQRILGGGERCRFYFPISSAQKVSKVALGLGLKRAKFFR